MANSITRRNYSLLFFFFRGRRGRMLAGFTTGGKDEPNIVLCGNRNGHHNTELRK